MQIDIETYKRHAGRVSLDEIDFDAFRSRPLGEDTLRCLRYMHDIEHHTVCYLRDLLVTSAHQDHEMTTFLALWTYEEFWHGEAIGAVLAAHDEPVGDARIAPLRRSIRVRGRVAPLLHGVGSLVAGASYTAVHMTWGAVNEWTTQAGYGRLAHEAGHPTLSLLLRRIMRQEGRHLDFYANQAIKRLESDKRAQWMTRLALTRFWTPVGSDIMPRSEVQHMVRHLFSGPEGSAACARIDGRIDRLPGLAGLGLLSGAAERYAA